MPQKSLILLVSYHHKNTEKIANIIADVMGAQIKSPQQVSAEEIDHFDLVGFGSGIYDGHHHTDLLAFADRLLQAKNGQAFLFSTFGAPKFIATQEFILKNHSLLREKLMKKGFQVVGEFGCAGFNTNSFLIKIGGINKGRPNSEDIQRAEEFARSIMT